MADFPTVDPIKIGPNRSRAHQQDIIPTAVKNRQFGNIVRVTGTQRALATLNNLQQVVFTITTSARNDQRLFCIPDISLCVNSIDFDHQLPGGSAINIEDWQVVFMGNDFLSTDNNNTKTLVFVLNISAGAAQDVILITQSRDIVNTTAT